ncbi:hypothetical protein [Massilia pseudoviolaceinigra]|uniref:hypothetical protein n=1 Tax=Massilia pseudoviolaceinigra TaxID=3057165 RepID=UPI0027968BB3|nr:hypothetical protein [Massilia sp. CCM 9206]MDQ1924561.1 hypothetical protein [Massilia sp. CCM 9206]
MPATTARNCLVDYYQSPEFADDVVGQIGQDPNKAKIYRQHIVDRLNTSLRKAGVAISDAMAQEQDRFVFADMPIADLVAQARIYALQWISDQNHKSPE